MLLKVCIGCKDDCVEYLEEWESLLETDYFCEHFGLIDIIVYCCTFNLFRYVMVHTWRDLYPKMTAWRCRCSEEHCICEVFPNVSLAAAVREGGQIDVRPSAAMVGALVRDIS